MHLLVVTQTIDKHDPYLGFFHAWIEQFARHASTVTVICLQEGSHSLPDNVVVHSLGKERGGGRVVYALRFISLAWRLRGKYQAVFVHMNQEYVLLGGLLWKLLRKPVTLWRNHYAGSVLTDMALALCQRVFFTSKHSYTARNARAVRMPIGVETALYADVRTRSRSQRTLLSFGRLAPSKHIEVVIEALELLGEAAPPMTLTVCGTARPEDRSYAMQLEEKAKNLSLQIAVRFIPGITHEETPDLFGSHALYVNCAQSGMLDKTIFEAAASGCFILTASQDAREIFGEETYFQDSATLAQRLRLYLEMDARALASAQKHVQSKLEEQALSRLIPRILSEIRRLVANP